jgi:hypothetical protein
VRDVPGVHEAIDSRKGEPFPDRPPTCWRVDNGCEVRSSECLTRRLNQRGPPRSRIAFDCTARGFRGVVPCRLLAVHKSSSKLYDATDMTHHVGKNSRPAEKASSLAMSFEPLNFLGT